MQVDMYECLSLSNCLNTSYFMCMRERDACRGACTVWACNLGSIYMCVINGEYDSDVSTSDCSDGIGEHVWVYVSVHGRGYLNVSE